MIYITTLNDQVIAINPSHIILIQMSGDTTEIFTSDRDSIFIKESIEEIVDHINLSDPLANVITELSKSILELNRTLLEK